MKPNPPKDLWKQLDAITGVPKQDDEGISAGEFAMRHDVTVGTAMSRLTRLAKQGKLIMGYKRHPKTGMPTKVFRPA